MKGTLLVGLGGLLALCFILTDCATGPQHFYRGPISDKMVEHSCSTDSDGDRTCRTDYYVFLQTPEGLIQTDALTRAKYATARVGAEAVAVGKVGRFTRWRYPAYLQRVFEQPERSW